MYYYATELVGKFEIYGSEYEKDMKQKVIKSFETVIESELVEYDSKILLIYEFGDFLEFVEEEYIDTYIKYYESIVKNSEEPTDKIDLLEKIIYGYQKSGENKALKYTKEAILITEELYIKEERSIPINESNYVILLLTDWLH